MVSSLFSVNGVLTPLTNNLCLQRMLLFEGHFRASSQFNLAIIPQFTQKEFSRKLKKETSINQDILLCSYNVHAFHFYERLLLESKHSFKNRIRHATLYLLPQPFKIFDDKMHLTMTWLRISSFITFEERSSHGIFRHMSWANADFLKRWPESFCQECEIYIFWIQLSCKIQFYFSWNVNFVSSHVLTYELITG